jgi:hypothetical protein
VVCVGVVIGILFLEETHEAKKHRRDPGLKCGKWLLRQFSCCTRFQEAVPLLDEEEADAYPSVRSPLLSSVRIEDALEEDAPLPVVRRTKPAVTKAFTPQVIRNIIGYGILAL